MPSHLITTRSTQDPCPRCGAPVYTGWAEGLHATVDTEPLDPANEVAALITGRWTYTRTPGGELVHRDAGRITGGSVPGTVHAQHRCTPTTLF
jgi:hypothetical protein